MGAADAFAKAADIFTSIGGTAEAQQLQIDYQGCKLLARCGSVFQADRRIFSTARYYTAFEVIGDCR